MFMHRKQLYRWIVLILFISMANFITGTPLTNAFEDNQNGTVTDHTTGLIWQQDTEDEEYTWKEALDYCEQLDLAGYSDWRLPSIDELSFIVDTSRYRPAINTTFFPNCQSDNYWSSTTYALNTSGAWGVAFDNGNDNTNNKTSSNYVRCVH